MQLLKISTDYRQSHSGAYTGILAAEQAHPEHDLQDLQHSMSAVWFVLHPGLEARSLHEDSASRDFPWYAGSLWQ